MDPRSRHPAAREVLAEMVDSGADPRQVIAERGLAQLDDEAAITALAGDVLAANPDKVEPVVEPVDIISQPISMDLRASLAQCSAILRPARSPRSRR